MATRRQIRDHIYELVEDGPAEPVRTTPTQINVGDLISSASPSLATYEVLERSNVIDRSQVGGILLGVKRTVRDRAGDTFEVELRDSLEDIERVWKHPRQAKESA